MKFISILLHSLEEKPDLFKLELAEIRRSKTTFKDILYIQPEGNITAAICHSQAE